MRRRLLPALLLLCLAAAASLALAQTPCKTDEEAKADAVVGFVMMQQVAAERCDEHMKGTNYTGLHKQFIKRHEQPIGLAAKVRAAYFQRAFGEKGKAEQVRVDGMTADILNSSMVISEPICAKLRAEFERRLAAEWAAIDAYLEKRVASIASHDKFTCKP